MKLPEMTAVASVGVTADYGQGPIDVGQPVYELQLLSLGKKLGFGASQSPAEQHGCSDRKSVFGVLPVWE